MRTDKERTFMFPTLVQPDNLERLVDLALSNFRAAGAPRPVRRRLLLTAHSGGGATVLKILDTRIKDQADEVHLYDALYGDPGPLKSWMTARLKARSATSAMRVVFADTTARFSLDVAYCLERLEPGALDHPAGRYRVERTDVRHMKIPPTFGWQILRDAGADLLPRPKPARGAPPRFEATKKPIVPPADTSPLAQLNVEALARIRARSSSPARRSPLRSPSTPTLPGGRPRTTSS